MDKDFIAQAAFDYLENGEDLPADATRTAASRFAFQTAIMKQTYCKSVEAVETAAEAKKNSETNKVQIGALVDKVNVRLGLVGGITVLANALLYWIAIGKP